MFHGISLQTDGFGGLSGQEFVREGSVGQSARAPGVVFVDRSAVAGGFAEANCPGNNGPVELLGEIFLNFGHYIAREVGSTVEHRHENALELNFRARFPDELDNMDDFGETFEPKPLTLKGDDDFVGCGEGGGHEDT